MLTPTQVAKRAQVTAQTIRNYSTEYADLLSPYASGETGARLYTDEDVDTLCAIAALRKSGVPPSQIADRIRNNAVPPIVEVTPQRPSNEPQSLLKTEDNIFLALQTTLVSHQAQLDALRVDFVGYKEEQKAKEKERVSIAITAFLLGAFFMLVVVALATLWG